MLGNAGIYAVKKRKKPAQKPKKLPGSDGTKSNPSKRHRDRLNGELDRLTGLLPFPEDVRSRLDKLSVLRLSVGYLKVKSFFKATMNKNSVTFPGGNGLSMVGNGMDPKIISEGDMLLQALNGFVLVVSAEGYVFYSSPTIQEYLGFHQSDVIHQSVFELIHTDDRSMFRRQLHFALNPKPFSTEQGGDGMQSSSDITRNIVSYNPEQLPPENSSFLERSFVCRFRCLLDNSSGFLALNFQGRLKYLHGQSIMGEDGTRTQSQLALFTIATPVQTPSILEIRSKTLIFQTKHKLDFTPTGVDTRGKIILGYTEIELCMRGSGYQFIHAADMMYCADLHLKMIKTGETGLTVFRLLTKSGAWVWVQANAKLIYKGGRPDFIIVRQRALVNAEGEEHLRQRKMHLPFNFATGEALLYDTVPTLDANDFQSNGMTPRIPKMVDPKEVDPQSLLGCLLKQDESIYAQPAEVQLPVDLAFMDSRALVNVPSNHWQVLGSTADGPSGVKQEEKAGDDSVEAMIDALEKMAQASDLCTALQELDVDSGEMKDWENALLRLSQGGLNGDSTLQLNDILTNDIFLYVEDALFKESGISVSQPSCQGTMNNNNWGELFTNAPSRDARPCKNHLLQNHDFNNAQSPPLNSLHAQSPNSGPVGMVGQGPNQLFSGTQRLSHFGPQIQELDLNIPTLQQMQLNDIFTPSVELPGLNLPATSGQNDSVTFDPRSSGSCVQPPVSHMACPQGMAGQHVCCNTSHKHGPPNGMQAQMIVNRQPQNSVGQSSSHVAHSLPSLIPCNGFASPHIEPSDLNVPGAFPMACMQGSDPFQRTQTNHRGQHWPQSQHQKLPPNGILHNGNKLPPGCHSQPPDTQKVLTAGLWPQNINGLYHTQQGGVTRDQSALSSSCMFESCSPSLPNDSHVDGTGQVSLLSLCQQRIDTPQDQSPSAGSCYFQWGHSDPVVGTSAITQDNVSISPMSQPLMPNMSSPEDLLAMQQYQTCQGQSQIPSHPADSNGLFSVPPAIDGNKYFTDQNQTHCCNF